MIEKLKLSSENTENNQKVHERLYMRKKKKNEEEEGYFLEKND